MPGFCLEDLKPGERAQSTHVVKEADIAGFAAVSGDYNPVHMDADFAAKTPFKTRIAHGLLTAAFVSAVLGSKLPGPGAIYVSQSLQFKRPVRIGDEVQVTVEVTAIDERRGYVTLSTTCSVAGKTVLTGEAVMLVARRADAASAAA